MGREGKSYASFQEIFKLFEDAIQNSPHQSAANMAAASAAASGSQTMGGSISLTQNYDPFVDCTAEARAEDWKLLLSPECHVSIAGHGSEAADLGSCRPIPIWHNNSGYFCLCQRAQGCQNSSSLHSRSTRVRASSVYLPGRLVES